VLKKNVAGPEFARLSRKRSSSERSIISSQKQPAQNLPLQKRSPPAQRGLWREEPLVWGEFYKSKGSKKEVLKGLRY